MLSSGAYKHTRMVDTLNSWRDKSPHSQFLRETSRQICTRLQWNWNKSITKEMEATVFAVQEQALSTNAIKACIFRMPCMLTKV